MSANNNNYNGWASYATWRVNLEFFDGLSSTDLGIGGLSGYKAGKLLKEQVEEYVAESCDNGTVQGWALAFVNECDFQEIAEHLINDESDDSEVEGNNNEEE